MEDLQRLLGSNAALQQNYYPNIYNVIPDKRTQREKLHDKIASNSQMILSLEKENEEIKEALNLLDAHPLVEKLNNLLQKLGVK